MPTATSVAPGTNARHDSPGGCGSIIDTASHSPKKPPSKAIVNGIPAGPSVLRADTRPAPTARRRRSPSR